MIFNKRKEKEETADYYHIYDSDPRKTYLLKKRQRRRKKRIILLSLFLVLCLITSFFISDLSKVKTIKIKGNSVISDYLIIQRSQIKTLKTNYLFLNTKSVKKELETMGLVRKASVKKDLIGNVLITVEEAEIIAVCQLKKQTYIIDELGNVVKIGTNYKVKNTNGLPKLFNFDKLSVVKAFAKAYIKVPTIIKNAVSDVIFNPLRAYPNRVRLIMDNNKEIHINIEDMEQRLKHFDYAAYLTEYKDDCIFSFEGGNIYIKKAKTNKHR